MWKVVVKDCFLYISFYIFGEIILRTSQFIINESIKKTF